jgi:hypothetical protein
MHTRLIFEFDMNRFLMSVDLCMRPFIIFKIYQFNWLFQLPNGHLLLTITEESIEK